MKPETTISSLDLTNPCSSIPSLVRFYRSARCLTLYQFGSAFGLSAQAVHQWQSGLSQPNKYLLVTTILTTRDWRANFASESLLLLDPELYDALQSLFSKAGSSVNPFLAPDPFPASPYPIWE
ncbi:MAG: hypothetical protein KA465_02075 [Anaerolineaceae bacterium]|nr:hypothetical protein [Anaerolineaceae bacterium]